MNRLGNSAEEYQEHYTAAREIVARLNEGSYVETAEAIAFAQIHATLAVAVATARMAYIR